jgi:16S rRNA processing protein RimM
MDQAKKLTNSELYVSCVDTREICKLEKKQFFWFDIIGCSVIENNEILGIVDDIQRMPLSDYLQVKTTQTLQNNKLSSRFLFPYLDNYIIKVDIENKTIDTIGAKDILKAS